MKSSMPPLDHLIGYTFDDYRITHVVGRGGMGTVYRAWDEVLERDVALKVISLDGDGRADERFVREARLAAKLDHDNIVRVYRSGRADGYLYLAMELIEGQSLRSLLQASMGGLPVPECLSIALQLMDAARVAHESSIIHRDIKPDNVLLKDEGVVKVLDFGVARLQDGAFLTRADEILGTVEYMAPEQILGEDIGPAVDLYAVGVVLYEMLTGTQPVSGDSPATLVYHQLNEEPLAPSFHNPAIPTALDRLVLRLLEKLPEHRFAAAGDAIAALLDIQRRLELGEISGLEPRPYDGEQEDYGLRNRDFQPRFTGRRSELDALRADFDALSDGGRMVFLAGEAGIGKSRLVGQLASYATEHGGRFVQGACFYEHGLGPFMPFLDAVSNLFGERDDASESERSALEKILREKAPELVDLATSSSTTAKVRASFAAAFGSDSDADAGRQRLFDTVFELFAAASELKPLVLCLEDVHWADEGSLQLLHYLVRRISECQVLCVVTYRPEELTAEVSEGPLSSLIKQLDAEGVLVERHLRRLSWQDTNRLVGSLFYESDYSSDFVDFLFEHAQGNPLVAVEILKLLRDQELLRYDGGAWTVRAELGEIAVPDRVRALVRRRVDLLEGREFEVIQLAAVVGHRFTSSIVEEAGGLSRMDALKSLFRLEKKGQLIVSVKDGFEFSHSMIREVLYEDIPWELKREYHRVVGSYLEERSSQGTDIAAAELGTHLHGAGDFARAIPYLTTAGDEAFELFSWRKASAYFAQVIEACESIADGTTDALIHALKRSALANVYLAAHDRAREHCERMRAEAHRAGRPLDEAEALKLTGKVDEHQRRFPQAVQGYEKAIRCLEGLDAPLARARILINWGVADFECGRYNEAESRWRETVELAAADGPREMSEALNNLAVVATMRGDLEAAWDQYERVLALDEQLEPSPQTALTYYNMGMLRADQRRWDDALELYERSLSLCRSARFAFHEPTIELNRTEALLGKGNLVEARMACGTALRGLRRLEDSLGVADALRLYGRLCRLERNWADGRTYLAKSIDMNRQFGESVSLAEALFELGLLERDSGHSDAALEPLRKAEQIFEGAEATLDLDHVRTVIAELEPVAKSA